AAALLLLVVYLTVVEIPQMEKAKQAEQTAEQLFNFKSSDIETIELRYPASGIELRKSQDGKWQVTKPLQTEADQREVQSLISTVGDIRFSRVVEEQAADLSEFGLNHPNVDITLALPGRAERLLLGDDGPMAGTLYARKDGDPRVVLAQQWLKGSLTRTVFDFRTKIVLPVEQDKVDQVQLEFPKQSVLLAKRDSRWFLKNPIDGPADEDAVRSLTLMLQNLRATFFIDPGPDREKIMKGLKKPLVMVTTRESENGAQKSKTARFYNAPEKDSVYVVTEPDRPIYRVDRAGMDELKPEIFHYQDKHLVSVQRDAVKGIDIHTPTERYALVSNDNAWAMEGETDPVNQDRVKRLLDQVEKLMAHQLPEAPVKNPAAVGLRPANDAVRLKDSAQKTLATLQLGNELKGMLYALGNPKLGIVMVNKDFLDEIPKKSELLKKEEPAVIPR
ncbi:MAG TPA: DUF4340 domain-containing protein, partial [Nitrospiria bacterium]